MVGSAITRRLSSEPCQLIRASRAEVDLTRQEQVEAWMAKARPEAVFVAAAKVGGIHANDTHPAEFLYDNMMIEANVIHAARRFGVEKLLFLGSSCIYKIGRASCRERVCQYVSISVVAVSLKKTRREITNQKV